MKKALSLILAVLLAASLFAMPVFAEGDELDPAVVSVSKVDGAAGETVTVSFSIKSTFQTSLFAATVNFDPRLELVTWTNQSSPDVQFANLTDYMLSLMTDYGPTVNTEYTEDEHALSLSAMFPSNAPTINGDLYTFSFVIPDDAQTNDYYPLTVTVLQENFWYSPSGTTEQVFRPFTTADGGINIPYVGSYTVTFMYDENNSIVYDTAEVVSGNTVARPDDPEMEGYSFGGWVNGNELYDFTQPVYSDLTLYPVWIPEGGVMYLDCGGDCFCPNVCTEYTLINDDEEELVLENGWYVVPNAEILLISIIVDGDDVNMILTDGCDLIVDESIIVNEENSITFYAQSFGDEAGMLEVTAANGCAAIGSDGESGCGTITINGGNITAAGTGNCAAIGGSNGQSCGTITINGGRVEATAGGGSSAYSSAIGGGRNASGGTININGGQVTAAAPRSNNYCAIGNPGEGDEECGIYLSWNDQHNVSITTNARNASNAYKGHIEILKPFRIDEEDGEVANTENIRNKTIVPAVPPTVHGETIEIRTRNPIDDKTDLRFVFTAEFGDSYLTYNGEEVPVEGMEAAYWIWGISADVWLEGSTHIGTVDVNNLWNVKADYFQFTVVVTGIPENKTDRVICVRPYVDVVAGAFGESVTMEPFCASVNYLLGADN